MLAVNEQQCYHIIMPHCRFSVRVGNVASSGSVMVMMEQKQQQQTHWMQLIMALMMHIYVWHSNVATYK